jgi:hypothetical protein
MHTIELHKASGSWIAVFSDPIVAAVMGSPAVVTPYLDMAPAEDVLRAIQALNPDCIVSLRSA